MPDLDDFVPAATDDIVLYEVNTPYMSTTHDLKGLEERLDAIQSLGVNTIWLMPIYPVGIVNAFGSPYCVRDYYNVNAGLGDMDDLRDLVQAAHERNMAVILDWVANHTAWDNPWIANTDWYSQDAYGNIISPPGTGWNDVADLNYNNADMRLAMIDAMEYWIAEANIDGFRCDAADYVPFDFWQQAIDSLHHFTDKDLILLAEGSRYDHFTAGFQMNYAWSFMTTMKNIFDGTSNASAAFITNTSEYSAVPAGAQKLRFITNHDESNIATPPTVYGSKEAALAAFVITAYLQGVPLIYCGQEVGVSSTSVYTNTNSINWDINPDLLAKYQSVMQFYAYSPVARSGDLTTYADPDICLFTKYMNSADVLVAVNVRNTPGSMALPAELQGYWSNALTGEAVDAGTELSLDANGYVVWRR